MGKKLKKKNEIRFANSSRKFSDQLIGCFIFFYKKKKKMKSFSSIPPVRVALTIRCTYQFVEDH